MERELGREAVDCRVQPFAPDDRAVGAGGSQGTFEGVEGLAQFGAPAPDRIDGITLTGLGIDLHPCLLQEVGRGAGPPD